MEVDNMKTPPSGGSSPANHRWNPTKEQITLLENLYKQGVRTPSAEQIREITTRLQVYGHIEGKNVFYWFQNHKARQRQKQKQDHHNSSMASFFTPRVHHHHLAVSPFHSPPPLSSNVICNPHVLPQSEIAFYPRCPKLLLPTNRKRAPRADNVDKTNPNDVAGGLSGQPGLRATLAPTTSSSNIVVQETLPLFPLHPTGVLQEKTGRSLSLGPNSSETSVVTTSSTSSHTIAPSFIGSFNEHVDAGVASHLFFDFLSEKGST